MHQQYQKTAAAALAVLLGLSPDVGAAAPAPKRSPRSAYDRLSGTKLAAALSSLGMNELMTQLTKETGGSSGGGGGDINEKVARNTIKAAKAQRDLARREALLTEAIARLRVAVKAREAQAAAAAGPLAKAQATIKRMQAELLLAVTQALTRGEPYANKLLFLQGAEADRKALVAAAGEAAATVRKLGEEIEDKKRDWRRDMRIWIVVARQVGGLEDEINYRAGWIRFYHGMAAKNTKAGRSDLRAVEGLVEVFTSGSRGQDVKQQSELLIARSLRESGAHEVAATMLSKVISGRGAADLRVDARFEQVRNIIEFARTLAKAKKNGDKKYDSVPAALKNFRTKAGEMAADDQSKRLVDLRATLLEHFLYETRASTEKDKNKAFSYGLKAQESLLSFVEAHSDPAVVKAFYKIVYAKYRDRTDYGNLSPVVLMAVASQEYNSAARDPGDKTPLTEAEKAALAKAGKILLAIDRKTEGKRDKVSLRVRPLMLWQLAFVMHAEKNVFESAKRFAQLAGGFPDHKLAYQAATNAKDVIHYHYKHAPQIADNLRWMYVNILRVYCGTDEKTNPWCKRKEVLPWNFQLAEQLAYLADKKEDIQVKEAKARAHNAALDVREAEQAAKETKDPVEKQRLKAKANRLKGQADRFEAQAETVMSAARKTYRKIAGTYERVPDSPSNHMAYMQARQRGLRYRKYVLDLHPDRTDEHRRLRKAESLAMAEQLLRYGQDVLAKLPNVKQARAIKDLKDWGSEAKLLAIELLFNHTGQGQAERAMRLLESMPKEWPGTPALQRSEDMRIRKLVEGGQIGVAIKALDKFIGEHPAEGDELLKMVITSLQDRIDRDEDSSKIEILQRWKKYVSNYVKLTGKLYERERHKPLIDRIEITRVYADALMKDKKFKESLEIFKECRKYDEEHSLKQRRRITEKFKPLHAAAAAAKTYGDLAVCRDMLKEAMSRRGIIKPADYSTKLHGALMETELALSILADMSETERESKAGAERIADGRTWISRAVQYLEKQVKGGVKVQALNVLGLARAYKGRAKQYGQDGKTKEMQADYEQALKYFRSILKAGLDMKIKSQARMRWLAELGYCECVVDAIGRDKNAVRDALRRIRIIEHFDSSMGGYRARFMTIRAAAERRLEN